MVWQPGNRCFILKNHGTFQLVLFSSKKSHKTYFWMSTFGTNSRFLIPFFFLVSANVAGTLETKVLGFKNSKVDAETAKFDGIPSLRWHVSGSAHGFFSIFVRDSTSLKVQNIRVIKYTKLNIVFLSILLLPWLLRN